MIRERQMKDLDTVQVEQLKKIADHLRQQRQEQSISLEEIALKTYIPLRLLQALEAGTVERLPEPVFIQGFIRRYADALGVDGWALAKTFSVEPPAPEPKLSSTDVSRSPTPPSVEPGAERLEPPMRIPALLPAPSKQTMSKFALPVGIGVAVLLGLGGMIAAINRSQPGDSTASRQEQTRANASGTTTGSTTAVDTPSSSLPVPPTPTTTALVAPQPAVSGSPTAAGSSPSAPTPELVADPNAPVAVAINLKNGDSWMEVIVDGKSEFQGMLKKGEQRRWSAKSKIELISGNAGAVYISYNNGAEKLLGDLGAVKTVTFAAENTTTPATTTPAANE